MSNKIISLQEFIDELVYYALFEEDGISYVNSSKSDISRIKNKNYILTQVKKKKLKPIPPSRVKSLLTPNEQTKSIFNWLRLLHGNGYVYIIHTEKKYYHAHHYTGYTTNLAKRITAHHKNLGSKLIKVFNEKNINWQISRIFVNTDGLFESYLKNVVKKIRRFCPLCEGSDPYYYFGGKPDPQTRKLLKF